MLRRLLAAAVTLVVASFVLFAALNLLPGDPIRALFGFGSVNPAVYQARYEALHLDQPFLVQYLLFMRDVVTLDFGVTVAGFPIGPMIRESLPVSLRILAGVLAMQVVVAPGLVWLAGMRPESRLDRMSNAAAVALVSVPALVAGFMLQAVLVYWTDVFDVATWQHGLAAGPHNYVMPILALGIGTSAHLVVLGREELLVTLAQPYVKLATAVGLRPGRVVGVHALRPAAGPIVQLVGSNMAVLVTGLIVVEDIFQAPGFGLALLDAIHSGDRILIITMMLFVLVGVILVNALADLVHAWLDPRVREQVL